jgi:hypothetical protein
MAKKRFSNQDELMIVNPGTPNVETDLRPGQIFFGEDGTPYRLEGLRESQPSHALSEFYLGDDGTLYRLANFGPFDEPSFREAQEMRNPYGRYFLGEDGTLYQVIRS